MTPSLAERLRRETRPLHRATERSRFMTALLRGRMHRKAYVALLRNLAAIYAALEPALAGHADDPAIAPFRLQALARCHALQADLSILEAAEAAEAGQAPLVLSPATRTYVRRLHELDAIRPELLLAHAYVRYLGDLSGGQLLRKIVADSPGLGAAAAVAFYDFGPGSAAAELAHDFRASLDQAPVDDADALVAEAVLSFEWHGRLFDELAEAHGIGV